MNIYIYIYIHSQHFMIQSIYMWCSRSSFYIFTLSVRRRKSQARVLDHQAAGLEEQQHGSPGRWCGSLWAMGGLRSYRFCMWRYLCRHMCIPMPVFMYMCRYLSIYLFIYLSIYPSIYIYMWVFNRVFSVLSKCHG